MSNSWDQRTQIVGVKNTSGERVPPFACMELDYTSTSAVLLDSAKNVIWKVKKPTSVGAADRARILINGPAWVEIDGYGSAVFNARGLALVSSSTAPTIGGSVGPVASQWYMSTAGSGWLYKSDDVDPEAYKQSSTIKSAYVELAGGGGSTGLAKSPATGIPVRSSDVPGVAVCYLAELWDDSGTIRIREKSPSELVTIYNTTITNIAGDAWIHWKTDGARKIIDVDDC